jgi:hypothetical protein
VPGDNAFSYAVLRLVPRVERGERINVGVVVFCRPLQYLEARAALDEARALVLWPDLDVESVRAHLEASGIRLGFDATCVHFPHKIDLRVDRPSVRRACPRPKRGAPSFVDDGLFCQADEFGTRHRILAGVIRGVHWRSTNKKSDKRPDPCCE